MSRTRIIGRLFFGTYFVLIHLILLVSCVFWYLHAPQLRYFIGGGRDVGSCVGYDVSAIGGQLDGIFGNLHLEDRVSIKMKSSRDRDQPEWQATLIVSPPRTLAIWEVRDEESSVQIIDDLVEMDLGYLKLSIDPSKLQNQTKAVQALYGIRRD